MKKNINMSVLVFVLSVMACKGNVKLGGAGGSTGGGGAPNPTNTARAWQDLPSTCGTATAVQTAMGIWSVGQIVPNSHYSQQFLLSITDSNVTVSNTCANQMFSRTASVTAPSHYQGIDLIIDQAMAKTVGDQELECAASIPAGQLKYQFKGSCLQVQLNGNHTMAHVSQ